MGSVVIERSQLVVIFLLLKNIVNTKKCFHYILLKFPTYHYWVIDR